MFEALPCGHPAKTPFKAVAGAGYNELKKTMSALACRLYASGVSWKTMENSENIKYVSDYTNEEPEITVFI